MAGTLGKLNTQPSEDLVSGANKLDQFKNAEQQVQQMGMVDPNRPSEFTGDIPLDITSLDDDQLGDLLARQSQWCAYVDVMLAKTTAARNSAIAREEFVRAKVRATLKADAKAAGAKMTVQDLNDEVETTQSVVESTSHRIYCETLYLMTKAHSQRAQLGWDTISRRITQRGQEIERLRRESNVAGVPVPGGFRRPQG